MHIIINTNKNFFISDNKIYTADNAKFTFSQDESNLIILNDTVPNSEHRNNINTVSKIILSNGAFDMITLLKGNAEYK